LPETENQKIKLFLSRYNVYKLYFAIRNLEIRQEKHFFYAPFNGSIISADMRIGSIARNGSRLGEVINLDDLEVEIPVPAADISWIDRSKSVKVESPELEKSWEGRISRIGNSIDVRTQSIPVFIKIRSNQVSDLFAGIFLHADIPGKVIDKAITIPRKIVYDNQYVYFIKNGRLDYRKVNIVRRESDHVIINGGLMDGDTIVTEVMQGVAEGMFARPKSNPDAERSD
jgi:RND family efflux transporter MFP subunit